MADLELTLLWLEMPQYFDRFLRAGFDSWGTVLEITEEDLESLGVELGHRRKLQREIANTRRLSQDPAFVTPLYDIPFEERSSGSLSGSASVQDDHPTAAPGKRGYRHHPKTDPHAPERPYSAYNMFSNQAREELKNHGLSFSKMAKEAGDRWHSLSPEERDYWDQKAAIPWKNYKSDLAEYQLTDDYTKYKGYATEFKAAQKAKRLTGTHTKSAAGSVQAPIRQKKGPSTKKLSHPSAVQPLSSIESMSRPSPQREEVKQEKSKLPIGRVRKESYSTGPGMHNFRVAQACEPCRQRKTKCHGESPTCKHCAEVNIECYYVDAKRDKDRRLVEDLWKKAKVYEELLLRVDHQVDSASRAAIQYSLLLPPQLEKFNSLASAALLGDSVSNASSDYGGGESVASGVGSMGSTDHANEEDFVHEEDERKTKAFVGQASEMRWMQRLEQELINPPAQGSDHHAMKHVDLPVSSRDRGSRDTFSSHGPATNPNPYPEDMDASVLGDHLDLYELPIKSTADCLVDSFFKTVHPSFPLIGKEYFMAQYEQYFATQDPANFPDRTFVAILHIVFAIGAVHAHLMEAEWAGHEKDHLLYFAKGRILGVDTGILNNMVYLGQVTVFALAGFYLTITDQINRAWNTIGVAVRCAQSLGMHLINTTPTLTNQQKAHRAKVWYSISTLERTLTVMTGRPSMIHSQDCTVTLSPLRPEEDSLGEVGHLEQARMTSSLDFGCRAFNSPVFPAIPGVVDSSLFELAKTPKANLYFYHYVALNDLAQQAMAGLYCPQIRHMKWSEIQRRIEELDGKLVQWNAGLPAPFNLDNPVQDLEVESYRIALGILSHSIRTVINRPCLCSLDSRITDQSTHSNELNHAAAHRCVASARAVLQLISSRPYNVALHQGTLWWMILHHLKRAATVVLLELAYRAEHMPSEAEDILDEAKTAVNWLRGMAVNDPAARRSWVTLSRLLSLAAQKVGGDTSDLITNPFSQFGDTRPMSEFMQPPPVQADLFDPNIWQSLDNHYTGHFFGDQSASANNPYGFFEPNGGQNGGGQQFYPPQGELGLMKGQQEQENRDQTMWPSGQEQPPGGWYGQYPAL